MKSTALKNSDSTLTKKYAAIFALCFIIAILLFTEHFFEDGVTRDELGGVDRRGKIGSEEGYIAPDFAPKHPVSIMIIQGGNITTEKIGAGQGN